MVVVEEEEEKFYHVIFSGYCVEIEWDLLSLVNL